MTLTNQMKLTSTSRVRPLIVGAVCTALPSVGGLLRSFTVGDVVFNLLPGHSFASPSPMAIARGALQALAGVLAGSAVWGLLMGRLAQGGDGRRTALAGSLGFAPITIGLAIAPQVVEPIALRAYGDWLPSAAPSPCSLSQSPLASPV
ncbi:MAG: hypothetical protein IT318_03285 [Anaerolineales bacterium]|nr:hypothetical protein [Anaerolineales bacterium]